MKNKIKILALFGMSGAGKDTIKKWLAQNKNLNNIVPYTTRPPRDNERDGEDYHFISFHDFCEKDSEELMLEITKFNDWCYGTSIDSLDKNKINVGVFNISGINQLLEDDRVDVLPIYVYCNDKTRLIRCINREKNPNCREICRRFLADQKDFLDIRFYSVTYDNSNNSDNYFGILNIPEIKNFVKDVG